jgi:hypothetical protein
MSGEPFTLTLVDVGGADDPPVIIRLRQGLKGLLRSLKFRCQAAVEGDGTAEVQRLQRLVAGLVDRIAAQHELLSRRAEARCFSCGRRGDSFCTAVQKTEGRTMKQNTTPPCIDARLSVLFDQAAAELDRIAEAVVGMSPADRLRLVERLQPVVAELEKVANASCLLLAEAETR